MNLKEDLEKHTLEELKQMYKLPKTKINKMIEEQGLKIKYIGRTPYTNQLIPIDDKRLAKYQNKKKRQQTNEEMTEDMKERNWPQREIDSRQKDIDEYDYKLGYLLYKINELQKQVNDIVKDKIHQSFMITICKKTLETKDWCGHFEEEAYGKRPEITKFDMSLITDEMVLGYLSNRLNPATISQLREILKGEG